MTTHAGGKRKGAGRPPEFKDQVFLHVRLEKKQADLLRAIAKLDKTTVSDVIRNWLTRVEKQLGAKR